MRGPYIFGPNTTAKGLAGRRYVCVWYADGSKGTTLYSRYLMEQKLGRRLHPHLETVDHINNDRTDDRIENLQILTRRLNSGKDRPPAEMGSFICPTCGDEFEMQMRRYRQNQVKQGKAGPYCSKRCSGLARHKRA